MLWTVIVIEVELFTGKIEWEDLVYHGEVKWTGECWDVDFCGDIFL
jgi:hypothetical protein